jgi:carbohydrate diacid regulator
MIHPEMAQRLVDRLCSRLPYNINVMNDEGIIIASRDPERRGTYHEAAHRICRESLPGITIDGSRPLPQGTLPGINLAVEHNGTTIGVVGITGEPEEIGLLSQTVKTAIETMVEHELYKERVARRQDRKKLLLSMLLYGTDEDAAEAQVLGEHLGYDPHRLRMPLFMPRRAVRERVSLLKALKDTHLHTIQDISMELHDGSILVFKEVALPSEGMIEALRQQVDEYLDTFVRRCREEELTAPERFYTGTVQSSFKEYRRSFGHALWLASNIDKSRCGRVCHFYDYFYEYLVSLLPREELSGILGIFLEGVEEKTLASFRETIRAYVQKNASIKETAGALGIHRNTVLQRLQRMKQILGIDPLHDEYQRSTLFALFGDEGRESVHRAHIRTSRIER